MISNTPIMSARKQKSVTVESKGKPTTVHSNDYNYIRRQSDWNGKMWSKAESPSKGKKRKKNTPDSWTSTGKKLKVEQPEEFQELQSPLGNIFTPSCIRKDLESDDEVPIKELRLKLEASNNTISCIRKDCHFTEGVAEISKGQLVDSQPLNSSATMEHLTGIQGNISNPSMSIPVSSVDQAAPLFLLENSVLTEPNPNSKFNNHTMAEHTPVKSVTSDILLPFEKTSSVWKILETTLEVFRQIPQTPHFMKLTSEHKDMREGVAVGLMMTYSILSDSIQRLSIHTEAKVFEEKIVCLESLEENGFIVDPIRSRLQQLINMKKDYTESSSKGVELKTELASEEKKSMNLHASANIHEIELEDIRNKIAELQERENEITDEIAGKLGLASKVEDNMSRLRENILSIDRSNELALEEFKRLISKPLGEKGI